MSTGAEPLVLLHGFTAGPAVWDPVLPALRAHHTVHVPALDGHRGGVPFPRGTEPSITAYADGLERELDARGLGTVHVAGNSLGGWLALELAARGRAKTAVCLAPAGGWAPGGWFERALVARFAGAWAGSLLLRPEAMRRPRLRRMVVAPAVAHPERVTALVGAGIVDDLAGCTALLPSLLRSRRRRLAQLGDVRCPVRIAWSAEDRVLSPHWARARFGELVPAAEQVELPGVGHVPMSDDPDLVARTILDVTAPGGVSRR